MNFLIRLYLVFIIISSSNFEKNVFVFFILFRKGIFHLVKQNKKMNIDCIVYGYQIFFIVYRTKNILEIEAF